jgi:hypothetical protein
LSRDGGGLPPSTAEGGEASSNSDGEPDEEEEDDDDIFTRGASVLYQLTFGVGPLGLLLADTKAGKGVYVRDFSKVQTKSGGPVATAVELSGRVRIGDLLTHVGAMDVRFSSADVVQDLLDKVRSCIKRFLRRWCPGSSPAFIRPGPGRAARHRFVRALPATLLLPGTFDVPGSISCTNEHGSPPQGRMTTS